MMPKYVSVMHICQVILSYYMALSDCDGGGRTEGPVACRKQLG